MTFLTFVRAIALAAFSFALVGCAQSGEVVELKPNAACVGTLEGCAKEDAVWVPLASTELDSRLEHEHGRTLGSIVALDDDIASRWGPRLVDLVRVVAEAITSLLAKS